MMIIPPSQTPTLPYMGPTFNPSSPPFITTNHPIQQNHPNGSTAAVSFRVHLHNVHAKLFSQAETDLDQAPLSNNKNNNWFLNVNFAQFQSFQKQGVLALNSNNNNNNNNNNSKSDAVKSSSEEVDWTLDRSFVYETKFVEFLSQRHLVMRLYSSSSVDTTTTSKNSNKNKNRGEPSDELTVFVSQVKIDLYTLACGTKHHELVLLDEQEKQIGVLYADVSMEQVSEVQLCIRSIHVSMMQQLHASMDHMDDHQIHLVYRHTGANSKVYHTDTLSHNENSASPLASFWQNLKPLCFNCTLKELLQESITIQVVRKWQLQYVSVAFCRIPLVQVISLNHGQTIPFNGALVFNDMICGSINCLVESRNVPVFSQLTNGKNVGHGIVGGSMLYKGVRVPTVPRFSNDAEAQHHLKMQTEQMQEEKKAQAPSFDPQQFVDTEDVPTNREVSQLLSQSSNLKLSDDRLSAMYHMSSGICVPACVKSSSSIYDLNYQYYEITILDSGDRDLITIGLSPQSFAYTSQPGVNDVSYGYKSESGNIIHGAKSTQYGPTYTIGDTIGCGVSTEGAVYFTKNGQLLGVAFYPITSKISNNDLFCTVALHSKNSRIRVNFGQERFKFNIKSARMPSGWRLNEELDQFGRFYFVSVKGEKTFVDPRTTTATWKEQNDCTSERLCNTLQRSLKISYSSQQDKPNEYDKTSKWLGIRSDRVLNALRMVPKSAFVPEELIASANIGQHTSVDINDVSFDLTSTLVIARALDEFSLKQGDRFMEIGSGCGFMTALAGLIVGNAGTSCGIDINIAAVQFARNKVSEFTKQTGIPLESVLFAKRNIFTTHNTRRHHNNIDNCILDMAITFPATKPRGNPLLTEYNAIFCGLEVQGSQIDTLKRYTKKGGCIITCVNGKLVKLSQKGTKWTQTVLMNLPPDSISQAVLPTPLEERADKLDTIRETLADMGYSPERIESGLDHIVKNMDADSDTEFNDSHIQAAMLNFCHVAHHPSLTPFNFSTEEIFDAIESFKGTSSYGAGNIEILIYLSNIRNFTHQFGFPTKKVKEVFQYLHCNLESIQRFLADAKYCRDRLMGAKKSSAKIDDLETRVNESHSSTRDIFHALMTFNNAETALMQLMRDQQ